MLLFLFYLFAFVIIIASISVVVNNNPVYSVFSLISTFIFSSLILFIIGAEYIAMTLIVVYVGAVMVLFLFVVTMLDIKVEVRKKSIFYSLPMILFFILTFVGIFSFDLWNSGYYFSKIYENNVEKQNNNLTNIQEIGSLLYTKYFLQFQMCGFILLIAMIGAIVLGLFRNKIVKRQSVYNQISRNPKETVTLMSVKSGEGVSNIGSKV